MKAFFSDPYSRSACRNSTTNIYGFTDYPPSRRTTSSCPQGDYGFDDLLCQRVCSPIRRRARPRWSISTTILNLSYLLDSMRSERRAAEPASSSGRRCRRSWSTRSFRPEVSTSTGIGWDKGGAAILKMFGARSGPGWSRHAWPCGRHHGSTPDAAFTGRIWKGYAPLPKRYERWCELEIRRCADDRAKVSLPAG